MFLCMLIIYGKTPIIPRKVANCIFSRYTLAEEKGLIFSTQEGFEVDKCASIRLIKRFIDENGVIKFSPGARL